MRSPVLELQSVLKPFGDLQAVDDLSLSISLCSGVVSLKR